MIHLEPFIEPDLRASPNFNTENYPTPIIRGIDPHDISMLNTAPQQHKPQSHSIEERKKVLLQEDDKDDYYDNLMAIRPNDNGNK